MITVILVILSVVAGVAALACAAVSGMDMHAGNQSDSLFTACLALGFQAAALALMWWAH